MYDDEELSEEELNERREAEEYLQDWYRKYRPWEE